MLFQDCIAEHSACTLPTTGEPLPGVPVVVIEKSDLEFDDELGGEVYKARWKSRNMTVAVKRLTGRVENGEVRRTLVCIILSSANSCS